VESLNQQIHSGQTTTIQVEHKRNQQDIELYDMKQQICTLKQTSQQQCADLSVCKKELCEERQKNTSLVQQVERMKSLVENLDQNKEELIKRL
jgi:hypothetical protein